MDVGTGLTGEQKLVSLTLEEESIEEVLALGLLLAKDNAEGGVEEDSSVGWEREVSLVRSSL